MFYGLAAFYAQRHTHLLAHTHNQCVRFCVEIIFFFVSTCFPFFLFWSVCHDTNWQICFNALLQRMESRRGEEEKKSNLGCRPSLLNCRKWQWDFRSHKLDYETIENLRAKTIRLHNNPFILVSAKIWLHFSFGSFIILILNTLRRYLSLLDPLMPRSRLMQILAAFRARNCSS